LVNAASDADLLKLLASIAITGTATCLVSMQAIRSVGILSGTGLRKGHLACATDGKTSIVTDVKVGAADLSAVGVEEGGEYVGGEGCGRQGAEEREGKSGELHVEFGSETMEKM
jgi:hypothetical protein